ncbi:hypothetical protein [Thermoactinomyces mirandus]|uniref:hypothetical protein n=1 Tax=Thermoactinomyces mirandus TaxID=2756294 RepID=UPI0015EF73F4|nr:hypothetical protein [Thermoactinomyces mirandus]
MPGDHEKEYWNQPIIYQQMAQLEKVEVETLQGTYRGELLWGVFFDRWKGICDHARADQKITGDLSYFVPVGWKREEDKAKCFCLLFLPETGKCGIQKMGGRFFINKLYNHSYK